jgi:hypothetical protein
MSGRGVVVGAHLVLPAVAVARILEIGDRERMLSDPLLGPWVESMVEVVEQEQRATEKVNAAVQRRLAQERRRRSSTA